MAMSSAYTCLKSSWERAFHRGAPVTADGTCKRRDEPALGPPATVVAPAALVAVDAAIGAGCADDADVLVGMGADESGVIVTADGTVPAATAVEEADTGTLVGDADVPEVVVVVAAGGWPGDATVGDVDVDVDGDLVLVATAGFFDLEARPRGEHLGDACLLLGVTDCAAFGCGLLGEVLDRLRWWRLL